MNEKILLEARLDRELSSDKTRHLVNGQDVTLQISSLKIIQLEDDPGYYLVYYDTKGEELTDTYHDSAEEALAQAKWETGLNLEIKN
jgi:hypothetical protein